MLNVTERYLDSAKITPMQKKHTYPPPKKKRERYYYVDFNTISQQDGGLAMDIASRRHWRLEFFHSKT